MKAEAGITIPAEVLRDMEEEAGRVFPEEACGLLLAEPGERRICGFRALENRVKGEEAERFFGIDPLLLYRSEQEAAEEGKEIIGLFHSHTDAEAVLSETDETFMLPGQLYLILSLKMPVRKRLRAYRKAGPEGPVCEENIVIAGEQAASGKR